jgi:hypothetical protein
MFRTEGEPEDGGSRYSEILVTTETDYMVPEAVQILCRFILTFTHRQ